MAGRTQRHLSARGAHDRQAPRGLVSTKYRCHCFCHIQMSLRAGAEPQRRAAPERRAMSGARYRTRCSTERRSLGS
jgi:hypothetical protein